MALLNKAIIASAIFSLTAACGGGSGKSAQDLFASDARSTDIQGNRINALPGTRFSAMPTEGSAVFNGYAALAIDPVAATNNDDIIVLGDLRLTANFDAATITGDVTDMRGATDFESVDNYTLVDVDGTIEIGGRQSLIGVDPDDNLQDRPNQWFADYQGDLEIEDNSYAVGGTLLGDFRGTRLTPQSGQSPIKALIGTDEDGYAAINGNIEEVPVTFGVFGANR